ncbi:DNA photolyase, FAD-binding/Cryptochrome [Suillus discolor]|uniref:DNA photolyase, FAD-binding/Cryptochrome n=1 Tax=Suillus discolor TaxID=1912936 RepID=A0A9P7FFI6_9AGAM|nr:DNA photolyase, FAD-binding/Cryptochrome [Suillus discolor]KAG2116073.1 DNA photolyase, FAD-binding/Cryptochrome [Suillus discolor]
MMKRARSPSPLAMSKKGRTTDSLFAPIKIATAEAAASVQTHPPYLRLLDALRNVVQKPSKGQSVVYWMRMGDLRISDNRALALASAQAVEDQVPLVVLHVLSPQDYIAHDRSKTRIDFVLRNLSRVKDELAKLNIPLYTLTHTPRKSVPTRVISVLQTLQSTRLFANFEYEVDELRRDTEVCSLAQNAGIRPTYVHDRCIIEPGVVETKDGRTYTVYSPYQRNWISILNSNLSDYLKEFPSPDPNPSTIRENHVFGPLFDIDVPVSVHGFELDPEEAANMANIWPAGTLSAKEMLSRFLYTKARTTQLGAVDPLADGAENSDKRSRVLLYDEARDRGDKDTTSRLSPYLSAGVISVRECVRQTMKLLRIQKVEAGRSSGVGRWVQELAWRDFYTNVLAYYPRVSMGRPFQERFADVKWEVNEEHLNAWKEGKTGIPIVDAAMRQINTMGWTHNRMRMIVAMFLSKDLMLDWRLGERYFMEKLIDGDLASNNGGWQWSASTGVDPAPYFRIFNPYTQSSKADPTGDFIRTFVPELKNLYGSDIHNPPAKVADKLGYPRPIVNHAEARVRAIRRYKTPGEE